MCPINGKCSDIKSYRHEIFTGLEGGTHRYLILMRSMTSASTHSSMPMYEVTTFIAAIRYRTSLNETLFLIRLLCD